MAFRGEINSLSSAGLFSFGIKRVKDMALASIFATISENICCYDSSIRIKRNILHQIKCYCSVGKE